MFACSEKVCELFFSLDNIRIVVLCAVIAVCGAFGGVVGGFYRWKCGICPKPSSRMEYFYFALFGIVSAFAIMLVCKWMGLVFDNPGSLSKGLYVIGISVVSGFFAMRILPHLGSVIEDRLSQLSQKVDETQNQVAMNIARIKDDEDYGRLLGCAEMALTTGKSGDRQEAIRCIEENLERFSHRRTLNIYYGRLLRKEGNIHEAIKVLENFTHKLRARHADCLHRNDYSALGAAYFNIACYYALLFVDERNRGDEKLLGKVKSSLQEAIKNDSIYERLWRDDDDLKPIADEHPCLLQDSLHG